MQIAYAQGHVTQDTIADSLRKDTIPTGVCIDWESHHLTRLCCNLLKLSQCHLLPFTIS